MILGLFIVLIVLFIVLPLLGMALWALLTTVIVGLVVGGLGRLVVPGYQRIGLLATVVAGLCGSVVGGFLGQHVLRIDRLLTVLVEVGISAAVVAVMSGAERNRWRAVR